ncbi:MAG: cupredoxin domain-containing protein [Sporichthyaceae bacterium]
MKLRIAVTTMALAAALAACGGGDDEAADTAVDTGTGTDSGAAPGTAPSTEDTSDDTSTDAASGTTLTMKNTKFSPASLSVKAGDTVEVQNEDGFVHNVTAEKGGIMTGDIKGKGTADFTAPDKKGTYDFTCTIHPGMDGTLKVS